MSTTQERFEAAIAAAIEKGVHIRVNVMECCRSCIGHEKLELPSREALDTTPYAYYYGGQDNELVWKDGKPYRRQAEWGYDEDEEAYDAGFSDHPLTTAYFRHGGPDLIAARALAEAFKAEGFEIEWDGSRHQCVMVTL